MTRRGGFTLIEVLVAIALIVVLVGTMYGFLFNLMSTRRMALDHARQEAAASVLIAQLEAALTTCLVGDRTSGSGVAGDARSIRVLSRGVAASYAARGIDDPDAFGDLQLAEYRFNPSRQRIEGRRVSVGRPARSGETAAAQPFSAIEGVVRRLRFRYYDGEQWLDSFDSMQRDRLPLAVEVAVWFTGDTVADDGGTSEGVESDDGEGGTGILPVVDSEGEESPINDSGTAISPVEDEPLIKPDRIRVIRIPDAAAHSTSAVDAATSSPNAAEEPEESP